MNKFWVILSHTYMTRFKTKMFLISTVITLLFMVGVANIQSIIDVFAKESDDQIAVIDESNELFSPLKKMVENGNDSIELVAVNRSETETKDAVQDDEYEGLITLSLNDNQLPEARYYANTITETGIITEIEQQLQQLKVGIATEQIGIDEATLNSIYEPVVFETVSLDEDSKTDEELNQARGIVYVMLFLLYMAVIIYGQMIAMDVATEKSSRVMELLISSAPPVTHMFAKIAGIALLGLTQVGLFVGVGYALIKTKQDELTGEMFEFIGFQNASLSIYLYAILFFILGYLLYATLAAMLGSVVSRVEDVQQLMLPMILLIIVAFFIAIFGLSAPESSFITLSSYIPFFTPMVMFLRVGMLDIPTWEIVLSIGVLIGSIVLLGMLGARVYRGGVLMYGRSSSFKDFKRAIVLSKKE